MNRLKRRKHIKSIKINALLNSTKKTGIQKIKIIRDITSAKDRDKATLKQTLRKKDKIRDREEIIDNRIYLMISTKKESLMAVKTTDRNITQNREHNQISITGNNSKVMQYL